jgi:hypothetical protein
MSNPKTSARQSTVTITGGGTLAGTNYTLTLNEAANTTESVNQRQVRALYQSILGRDPDQAGFAFWTGQGAGALGSMIDQFMVNAPETFGTDWMTMLAYQGATGVAPSFSQFLQSVAALRSGALTPATLFSSLAPSGLTTTQVYQNLLGRNPNSTEAAQTPFAAFQSIIASSEFQTGSDIKTHTNTLYIRWLYYVILSRDPDVGGLNFWLNIANSIGNGVYYAGQAPLAARINNIIGTGSTSPGSFLGYAGSPEFQFLFQ